MPRTYEGAQAWRDKRAAEKAAEEARGYYRQPPGHPPKDCTWDTSQRKWVRFDGREPPGAAERKRRARQEEDERESRHARRTARVDQELAMAQIRRHVILAPFTRQVPFGNEVWYFDEYMLRAIDTWAARTPPDGTTEWEDELMRVAIENAAFRAGQIVFLSARVGAWTSMEQILSGFDLWDSISDRFKAMPGAYFPDGMPGTSGRLTVHQRYELGYCTCGIRKDVWERICWSEGGSVSHGCPEADYWQGNRRIAARGVCPIRRSLSQCRPDGKCRDLFRPIPASFDDEDLARSGWGQPLDSKKLLRYADGSNSHEEPYAPLCKVHFVRRNFFAEPLLGPPRRPPSSIRFPYAMEGWEGEQDY